MPRRRTAAAIVAAAIAAAAVIALVTCAHRPTVHRVLTITPRSPAAADPTPQPSLDPDTWVAWAFHDHNGWTTAGGQTGTTPIGSIITIGLVADYLHGIETAGRAPTSTELDLASRSIRDSDAQATEAIYRAGGGDTATRRVVDGCQLRHATLVPGSWSETGLDAAATARLGTCLTGNYLVSATWTGWILDQMRHPNPEARFGIIQTRPLDHGQPLAIINTWTIRTGDNLWHVNCLAIAQQWILTVLTHYPAIRGPAYGAALCARAATSLPPDSPPPVSGRQNLRNVRHVADVSQV